VTALMKPRRLSGINLAAIVLLLGLGDDGAPIGSEGGAPVYRDHLKRARMSSLSVSRKPPTMRAIRRARDMAPYLVRSF